MEKRGGVTLEKMDAAHLKIARALVKVQAQSIAVFMSSVLVLFYCIERYSPGSRLIGALVIACLTVHINFRSARRLPDAFRIGLPFERLAELRRWHVAYIIAKILAMALPAVVVIVLLVRAFPAAA